MNGRDSKVLNSILLHIEHTLLYAGRFETLEEFSSNDLEVVIAAYDKVLIMV